MPFQAGLEVGFPSSFLAQNSPVKGLLLIHAFIAGIGRMYNRSTET
jgi:formamidopyrimidine-DNA glycosylase